jgi:anti-sigma regulatory factor (Ser/Thr protein kinase)
VSPGAELRLSRPADVAAPRPIREALGAFLAALDVAPVIREDILVAVGEALANSVEHAYGPAPGAVEIHARARDERMLLVDVLDGGRFIERDPVPGRGLGLRIVHAIARAVHIETAGGTRVSMVFDTVVPPA